MKTNSRSANIDFSEYPSVDWGVISWFPYRDTVDGPYEIALRNQVSNWKDDDNITDIQEAMTTVKRLREGAERFLITDINNPAGSAQAQTDIIVMFDAFGGMDNPQNGAVFNHIPGGSNVLYMDGHVSFVKLNADSPSIISGSIVDSAPLSFMAPTFNPWFLGGWG